MKILLINHYAGAPAYGMEYRPYFLASEWVKMGHEVRIVGASFSHLRRCQPVCKQRFFEEKINGVNYIWVKTPSYHGNGFNRAINIFCFVISLMVWRKRLLKDFKADIVIASSTYPLDIVPAFYMARESGGKLVFELHDLWPLSPIELGGMSPRHPFIMLMQWAEDFMCRKTDLVISILPRTEEYLISRGLPKGRFSHVPNGVNPEEWEGTASGLNVEIQKAITRLKNDGYFLVGYAGAHGIANALDVLVFAAALLSKEEVSFILVGKGPEKENLEKMVRENGLNNVHFFDAIPRQEIPAFLSLMDALFAGSQVKSLYRYGISFNKLMDYMMSSRPIISAINAGNDIVADAGCGISVPKGTPQEVSRAVKHMMSVPQVERELMGRRGREYVVGNNDYRILAKNFIECVKL